MLAPRHTRRLVIGCPFGVDGTVTIRAEDQTVVGYVNGWGTTLSKPPCVADVKPADWGQIFELKTNWKKRNGTL